MVCEIELSQMGKSSANYYLVCTNFSSLVSIVILFSCTHSYLDRLEAHTFPENLSSSLLYVYKQLLLW